MNISCSLPPLVSCDHVSKIYQVDSIQTKVLEETSLTIESGEFVVVLGVSGSGKTTLLNLVGAMDQPTQGKVLIEGHDISHASEKEVTLYRRKTIGFIFQFYNLFPTLTAAENIAAGLELLNLTKQEIHQRTQNYLRAVGLEHKTDKFPVQLSGGEQQRVAIARALAKQPKIVLADEPTGNLDEETGRKIMDLMRDLNKKTKTTFIVVTHNPEIAKIADRILTIHEGKIEERVVNLEVPRQSALA